MAFWRLILAVTLTVLFVGCTGGKPHRPGEPDAEDSSVDDGFKAEDHFELGMIYYNGAKLKEAESQFLLALKKDPKCSEAHNALGYTYYFQAFMMINAKKTKDAVDLHNRAVTHFEEALKLKPKCAEALVGLSMVNYDEYYYFVPRKSEYRIRAVSYLDKARETAPGNESVQANVAFHSAKLLVAEKAYKEATRDLEEVVAAQSVDPNTRSQARYMLASCYYMAGQPSKAVEYYRAYLDNFPDAPDKDDVMDLILRIQAGEFQQAHPNE